MSSVWDRFSLRFTKKKTEEEPENHHTSPQHDSGHSSVLEATQSGGDPVAISGYVSKRGGKTNPAYKRRWVVATDFGRIIYFPDPESTKPLGQFSLKGAAVDILDLDTHEFVIMTPARDWFFMVESEERMVEWIKKLNSIIMTEFSAESTEKEDPLKVLRSATEIQEKLSARGSTFLLDLSGVRHAVADVSPNLNVAALTWNLAERLPPMEDLEFMKKLRVAQIVVIGVQECHAIMGGDNMKKGHVGAASVWQSMCKSMLGKRFIGVAGKTMGPIHINMYVRADIIAGLSELRVGHVSCGVGNVLFNKGAVGVTCRLHGRTLVFVCAHLAARTERIIERRDDLTRIDSLMPAALGLNMERYRDTPEQEAFFDYDGSDDDSGECGSPDRSGGSKHPYPGQLLPRCADVVVFLGDLNYRVEGNVAKLKNMCRCYDAIYAVELKTGELKVRDSSLRMGGDTIDSDDESEDDDEALDETEEELTELLSQIEKVNTAADKNTSEIDDGETGQMLKPAMFRKASVLSVEVGRLELLGEAVAQLNEISDEELAARVEEIKAETGFSHSGEILDDLLSFDQLSCEKSKGRIFKGYREAPITFKPTYKFNPGTEQWDTGKKDRAPAWCDRILLSSSGDVPVDVVKYDAFFGCLHSDHRPVACSIRVGL